MKLTRSSLTLLALNVAWLATLTWFVLRRNDGAAHLEPEIRYVTNYVPVLKGGKTVLTTNLVAAPNDFRWAQLESEDYRTYITRLRAVRCPEQTIRDIVIADVDKLLAPKLSAANPRARSARFWQPVEQELWEDAEQKDALSRQRAVDFEKREVIRELLGVDLVGERLRQQGQEDYYGQRLDYLPEEKRAKVRLVLDQFADHERALLEKQVEDGPGSLGGEALSALRQQKEAALASLLNPQEREQYDLWFSPTASAVRDSVYGMNASQEEFLKLYQLQRQFTQQFGSDFGPGHPGWNEYLARAQGALGPQRFDDYQRAQDGDYRELYRLASRLKLNPEVATELYSYKAQIEQARQQVEQEASFTPQQRVAAHQAITEETHSAFREALGEKAFKQLLQREGNQWIRGNVFAPPGAAR